MKSALVSQPTITAPTRTIVHAGEDAGQLRARGLAEALASQAAQQRAGPAVPPAGPSTFISSHSRSVSASIFLSLSYAKAGSWPPRRGLSVPPHHAKNDRHSSRSPVAQYSAPARFSGKGTPSRRRRVQRGARHVAVRRIVAGVVLGVNQPAGQARLAGRPAPAAPTRALQAAAARSTWPCRCTPPAACATPRSPAAAIQPARRRSPRCSATYSSSRSAMWASGLDWSSTWNSTPRRRRAGRQPA